MIDIIILVLSVVVSIATGLFVYARNPKHIVNKVYTVLTFSLVLFSVANYFSLQTVDRLFYIRTVIFCSTLAVASLYYMVLFFGDHARQLSKWQRIGIGFTLLVALLDFTPLVFQGLNGTSNPVPIPNFGAVLFVAHLIIFLASSCVLLVKRSSKSKGVQRLQYVYMLIGVLPMFLLAPITSVMMPVALKNTSLIFLSPIYGTFFVCLIGYAIIRHRLFDIRPIIARSLGYAATILVLASVYGFLFLGITQKVFHLHLPFISIIFFSIATSIAALVFQQLKTTFDKVTNKLFYHDSYDPQSFLDQLNRVVVSNVDTEPLLEKTSQVIESHIKSDFCAFSLRETAYLPRRTVGNPQKELSDIDAIKIRTLTANIHKRVIVADEVVDEYPELYKILRENDIEILTRLVATVKYEVEGIGYLMLGPKKSGNPYTKQDADIIRIASSTLVIAIENSLRFEEIQNFNITLQNKVDDATRELRRTNEKLKSLDETKDEFISMASHQLRTPLTSVKGYLSMVLEGDAGKLNEMQEKLLNQAFVSSQRMVYLIADLLNVSRLRTGKFIIDAVPTNLADVIEGEVGQLVETAQARGLELKYNKPNNFPTLMLDETKIRQVLMNFIDNAIYYTPSGGHITVNLSETPDAIEYTVTDDGIGVPKAEQHQLFTKFYRAGNAKQARPDGTGLGLYMARKVVVAQGGTIIFKSQEAKGSIFGFSFAKAKLLPPEITPAETLAKEEKKSLKEIV
ncbi:MAG: putative Histidine kinase [Candidatus Saccharibacteria bacterium]|nr:putative Histidine kinase [Candidatus Saccharibacteria bacterium]